MATARHVVEELLTAALGMASAACLPHPGSDGSDTSTTSTAECGRWHPDEDGDGFGAAGIAIDTCNPAPGWLMDDRDCYDDNADARPDQVAYFAVHRGDASFDYDCDGFSSAALLDLGGCHGEPMCPDDSGWRTGLAECGRVEDYVTECSGPSGGAPTCTWIIEKQRQECR